MKKIKIFVAGMVVAISGLFATPVMAVDCPSGTLRQEVPTIAQCNLPDDKDTAQPTGNLWTTVKTIIDWVLAVLGIVAVVMIIIGGINYMTSQGDSTKVKKGRDTILYGVIGLIIALLAFAIVNFVLDNVFNSKSGNSGADTSQSTQ